MSAARPLPSAPTEAEALDALIAAGVPVPDPSGTAHLEAVTGGALNLARTFSGYGEVDAQAITVNSQDAASWSLNRDNIGRITDKTEIVDGVTSDYVYTYDAMGRLLTVSKDTTLVEEYQYDLNGTRIYEMNSLRGIAGRSYSYSDEDHLLSAGLVTYDYDWDGFLTTRTDGSGVTGYTYSSRGELLSVSLPDGRVIEYVHDPLGRRIAKKIDGTITEKYLWQGLTRLLAVYDGSDTLLMRFVLHFLSTIHFLSDQTMCLYFLKKYAKEGRFSVLGDTFLGQKHGCKDFGVQATTRQVASSFLLRFSSYDRTR